MTIILYREGNGPTASTSQPRCQRLEVDSSRPLGCFFRQKTGLFEPLQVDLAYTVPSLKYLQIALAHKKSGAREFIKSNQNSKKSKVQY